MSVASAGEWRKGDALLLAIAYVGFISLGLPDTVAGVAWPSVRETFTLPQSGLGLIFIAMGCGYIVSSIFAGKLVSSLGVGSLLAVSSLLVSAAMFGCAVSPVWPIFVACALLWGLGSGAIDTGLNAFVASRFSARYVNWLHAFYSLGATLGPLLTTGMLVRAGSWRLGYALVGSVLFAMAATFLFTRHRWVEAPRSNADETAGDSVAEGGLRVALRHPLVWLQIIVFFLYTGLELMVGQWTFTLFTESRAVRAEVAGMLVGSYFGSIGVGRVLLGAIADRVGVDRLVRFSTMLAILGTALIAVSAPSWVGMVGLVVTGLGLAPIFPCLMSRTPQRVGAGIATHAIGFQVAAAMLGVAIVPGVAGILAQWIGLESVTLFAICLAALLAATHELLLFQAAAGSIVK